MLPDADELPPPPDEFYEREARKANHYTAAAWWAESPVERAKMIVHEMVKGMRDSWYGEKLRGKDGPKKEGGANKWDEIRKRFFRS